MIFHSNRNRPMVLAEFQLPKTLWETGTAEDWRVYVLDDEVGDPSEGYVASPEWMEWTYENPDEAATEGRGIADGSILYDTAGRAEHYRWTMEESTDLHIIENLGIPTDALEGLRFFVVDECMTQYETNQESYEEKDRYYIISLATANKMLWGAFGVNTTQLELYSAAGGNVIDTDDFQAASLNQHELLKHADRKATRFTSGLYPLNAFRENTLDRPFTTLGEFLHLYALLQVRPAPLPRKSRGDFGPPDPMFPCGMSFAGGLSTAVFTEADNYEPVHSTTLPGGAKGKALDCYNTARRAFDEYTQAIADFRESTPGWSQLIRSTDDEGTKANIRTKHKTAKLRITEAASASAAAYLLAIKLLGKRTPHIIETAHKASAKGFEAHIAQAEANERRASFVRLGNTLKEATPHMTVLPAGPDAMVEIRPGKDPAKVALMQAQRMIREGTTQLVLRMPEDPLDGDPTDLARVASTFLGKIGLNWLFPVGYVALARLNEMSGTYEPGRIIDTSVNQFWGMVYPNAAEKISKKGVNDWWKSSHKKLSADGMSAETVFFLFIQFLQSVRLPYTKYEKGRPVHTTLEGIIHKATTSVTAKGAKAVGWQYNPAIVQMIQGGEGITPSYMVTNHEAMVSYKNRQKGIAPALQLFIETQIRFNAFKGRLFEEHNGVLLTPKNDGYTYGKIAERIGMPDPKDFGHRPARDDINAISTALDAIAEAGVLQDWKVQRGAVSRSNPYSTKVELTVSEDYRLLYTAHKLEREHQRLRDQLANPFSPPKREPSKKKPKTH